MKLLVVTGLSGAGKTTALRALEDVGWYCADNLPIPLLPKFLELLATHQEVERAALVIDARGSDFMHEVSTTFAGIRAAGHSLEVIFLDAPDEMLIRRFSETRRRHPLSDTDVRAGLQLERQRLQALRQEATAVVDTGGLTVHALRGYVQERYARRDASKLSLVLLSFGFRFGLPVEADIVLDVRFLPNPFFVESLSPLSGEHEAVHRFVMDNETARGFVERADALLALMVEGFAREGKSYATVAIGCTGGRHRSVAIAAELGRRLHERFPAFPVSVRHRDVNRAANP